MKWKTGLILGLILITAGLILGWQLAPRVQDLQPSDSPLFSRQPIVINFSRPMDPVSMDSHFSLEPSLGGDLLWNDQFTELSFEPDKTWPAGKTIKVTISSGAKSRIRLPLFREKSWSIPVSPIFLAYLWPADGNSTLYLVNPETGVTQELITEPGGVLDYSTTVDGAEILYSMIEDDGESSIVSLNRLTGNKGKLITCLKGLCRSPRVSPDGSLIAYEFISRDHGIQPGIRVFNLQNNTHSDLGVPSEYLDNPLWSASGWLSYYNHTQQGYIFWYPDGEETIFLPNETGGDGTWSADGRYFVCSEILFVSETLAPRHLQSYDLTEGTLTDLSQGKFLEDLNPSFSPRGTVLAFGRKSLDPGSWSPGRQLWVMDITDGQINQLTDEMDYHHTSFAWHPDGERLAFVRYNQAKLSEPPEIWMTNRDGTEKIRLIINGFSPSWIP